MHRIISSILSRRLIDRAGGHRRRVLDAFREKQVFDRLDEQERRRYQDERLAALLNHAWRHVPRFRDLRDRDVEPAEARERLRELPVMKRADIQVDRDVFISDDAADASEDATGGSTGTPMHFKVDAATKRARESSLYWSDSLAGWQYGDRMAMLWGSDKDVKSATQKLRSTVRWWIENRRWHNTFNLSEDRMAQFHRTLNRFRPHLIVAYAGAIEQYGRYLRNHNIKPDYPLRAIVSSAEMLTPSARKTAEDIFGKPVYDRYGNREFGAIAAECSEHTGLHINEMDCIVEIDSPDPWREPGRVLITHLWNRAMPFIRYDTGDLACWASTKPCSCGRRTARLTPIAGRQADIIRTSSGGLIHGEFITHVLYNAQRVRAFQFVQETKSRYILLLAADAREEADVENGWREKILEVVGRESELEFRYMDAIPILPSGKRKFIVSKLTDNSGSGIPA